MRTSYSTGVTRISNEKTELNLNWMKSSSKNKFPEQKDNLIDFKLVMHMEQAILKDLKNQYSGNSYRE